MGQCRVCYRLSVHAFTSKGLTFSQKKTFFPIFFAGHSTSRRALSLGQLNQFPYLACLLSYLCAGNVWLLSDSEKSPILCCVLALYIILLALAIHQYKKKCMRRFGEKNWNSLSSRRGVYGPCIWRLFVSVPVAGKNDITLATVGFRFIVPLLVDFE